MIRPASKEKLHLVFDGGYLRALLLKDVHSSYIQGLNNPEVNRFLDGVRQSVQTNDTVVDFVTRNEVSEDSVLLGIWQDGAEHHCGTVRLHGINSYHKTANIGICIFDKTAWGKKLGTKVIKAVTQWAFDDLKLRWIEAGIYQENRASQKAFTQAGYIWICDIPDKYILEGHTATVKVYAAKYLNFQETLKC